MPKDDSSFLAVLSPTTPRSLVSGLVTTSLHRDEQRVVLLPAVVNDDVEIDALGPDELLDPIGELLRAVRSPNQRDHLGPRRQQAGDDLAGDGTEIGTDEGELAAHDAEYVADGYRADHRDARLGGHS